jgi:tetratricopeptide (TPR) repeat protein
MIKRIINFINRLIQLVSANKKRLSFTRSNNAKYAASPEVLMALSDREINYLLEKTDSYIDSRGFAQAIKCMDQVIDNTNPHPEYFYKRAGAYACNACLNNVLEELESACEDINRAIELDPQNGTYYWRRGAYLSYRLTIDKNISNEDRKNICKNIIKDYENSLNKDPSNPKAWLDIIETNMILNNWRIAIALYGESNPYILSKEDKLIRAWLGCIARICAGKHIREEDKSILYDKAIRLNKSHWYTAHIELVLNEIRNKKGQEEKFAMANEIHQLFISHYDELPW